MSQRGPDDLGAAAEALYARLPAQFVPARNELVTAAKAAGDRDLAREIGTLRRPTLAAWMVNLLAHDGALTDLLELGAALREAQSTLDVAAMKELGVRRQQLVGTLVERAVQLARTADPQVADSAGTREQVGATLTAALADPAAEHAVSSGRLITALSYAGFGEVEIGDAVAPPLRVVPPAPPHPPPRRDEPKPEPAPSPVVSARERAKAQQAVERATAKLEVAQASLDQARSRRAQARRELDAAQAALAELGEA